MQFQERMRWCPRVPWTVDVDTHWHVLRQWILQVLKEVFPKSQSCRKRSAWMSDATLCVVQARRHAIHRCK
eukprot:6825604-Alexandrium_andersonii.AAC.1